MRKDTELGQRKEIKQYLRWSRALTAALVAEILLTLPIVWITGATPDSEVILSILIPPAAFLVFIPAGYWTARSTRQQVVLNGSLLGLMGIGLYVLLTLVADGTMADFDQASSLRPAYLLAHMLKIVGGACGGWLVLRRLAHRSPSGWRSAGARSSK